jgi:putative oxidoreductase
MNTRTDTLSATATADAGQIPGLIRQFISLCTHIPNTLLAFVARFSIAAVFWKSGETKIQGFAVDLVNREFTLGWPRL